MTVRSHDCCDSGGASPAESTNGTGRRWGPWAAGGSVLSAALASACCWLPLVLLALGLSAGGVGGFFAKFRPLFLGLAVIFLGTGFYFTYFRKVACRPDEACAVAKPKLQRLSRTVLWVAAAAVAAFALFPSYAGFLLAGDTSSPAGESDAGTLTIVLQIEGMTCEGCAANVQSALSAVPGVRHVSVSFDNGEAHVSIGTDAVVSVAPLVEAVEKAGYSAMHRREE